MEDKNLSNTNGQIEGHIKKLLEDKIMDVIIMSKKLYIMDYPMEEEYA
jgi:hypothetical protein